MMVFLLFLQSLWAKPNVILFIGDGMGPSVVTASRIQYKSLAWDDFPHSAFVSTKSTDNHVTDSAAAATAMASGVKTDNGVLGLGPKSKKGKRKPLKTLADMAKEKNYAVGLVTTTQITHATPAAFYAHNESRQNTINIANDLMNADLEVIFGGGNFSLLEAIDKNKEKFTVIKTRRELPKAAGDKPYIGIFNEGHLPYYLTKKHEPKRHPRLYEMAKSAIEVVTSKHKNFFLMIEGGNIDRALHKNDAVQALLETAEFSKAVSESMKLLEKKKLLENTLIIVTADHDTAGLAINGYLDINKPLITKNGEIAKSQKDSVLVLTSVKPHSAVGAAHTAVDIPLYARGPCSESFRGLIENSDIFHKIAACWGN